jgi:signal transduction histidine kinase
LIYFSEEAFTFCILFFVLSVTATLANSPRLAVLWLVIFTAITGYFFIQRDGWGDGVLIWLPFVGGYFFFGVFASALRRANQAQRESAALLQELRLAHQKLQEYAGHVEALAVAQERNRMAREMHDTLGHRLTVASVQLEGAQRLIERDPTRASQMVGTVREQVREALKELRQAVARLREPLESDLPLNQSLPRLATSFQEATGLPVHLALPESLPMLPASHCQALYRAAQEGLTNIQRHAQAGQAWLEVSAEPAAISLAVSDDGTGYPGSAPQGGFGLAGLFERAAQLGGEARLEQRQGGGARLIFTLPLDSEAEYG